jgi:aerotaxis receptor
MRKNLPVTNTEYPLGDDTLIVSKTDPKGRLTYFNDQFVEISGFNAQELMGQPHNIVRHPDMPPEAFDDLWKTIEAGKPWTGAVKNRRKNGDFYWVLASATPLWEHGQITGYMSIRSKLPLDQRAEAEHVYALIRAKKAQKYRVEAGIIRRRSLADHVAFFSRTLQARLVTLVGCLAAFLLAVGLVGMMAVYGTNADLTSLHDDRLVRISQLGEITGRMQAIMLALSSAAADGRAGQTKGDPAPKISAGMEALAKAHDRLMSTAKTADLQALGADFGEKRREFVEQGLKPGMVLASAGKFAELARLNAEKVTPLFVAAKGSADELVAFQMNQAKAEYDGAQNILIIVLSVVTGILTAGFVLGGLLARSTIRAVIGPIAQLNGVMEKIAQGQFNSRVVVDRDDEVGIALRNLQALQAKLGFDRMEQRDTERRASADRKSDMQKVADLFEGSVQGAVEQALDAGNEIEKRATGTAVRQETGTQQSITVANAAMSTRTKLTSLSAATHQMSASITEISRSVAGAAAASSEAVQDADGVGREIGELAESAKQIGAVLQLISDIAGQTNLLALNATIEAARAGEAGRGFSVVATEVKSLAAQTARATVEITQKIEEIQSRAVGAVAAVARVRGTIDRVAEMSGSVAAAVEEQSAVTADIARNVSEVMTEVDQVSASIGDITRGAIVSCGGAIEVLWAADDLGITIRSLKGDAVKFLERVRA